jgi:acylphosphatase
MTVFVGPPAGENGRSVDGSGDRQRGSPVSAIRGRVSGRVQGVGFRWFVLQSARRIGVGGDVRNLPDGTVELRAKGSAEQLRELLEEVRCGPPGSSVESLSTKELDAETLGEVFEVRP